jgi:hypothetical protein
LKSPLGDLRNKLFTRTASGTPCAEGVDPFCAPSHRLRGDTITFNRQTFGDFGGAEAVTWGTGARAAFGLMSATEANTLAGRDPGTFNDRTLYTTFRSELWPTEKVHYNKYVPPATRPWDYNHDLIPDTLALDTCGRFGCVAVDSDTMPGGWLNRRGNIGGLQSLGPFSLKAGDTTSFVYAMVGDSDSTKVWGQIHAVIDLYLNFYLSPEPPPAARVVSTQVTPGTDAGETVRPQVRLHLSDEAETWVDPYLLKVAADLDAALPGTALGELAAFNPALAAAVRARAADNVEQLELYKSCDQGTTFTADDDCAGDPTADVAGPSPGLGWQAYRVFRRDPGGDLPNVFTDDAVQDGRRYLYVVVAKTRGATFPVATAGGAEDLELAPSVRNVLSRATADPNVVSVYVPVSRQAGARPAVVSFTARPAGATVPFVVEPMDSVVGGTYRAIFGNELVVDRLTRASGEPLSSIVTIARRETVDVNNSSVMNVVIESQAFPYARAETFPVAGTGAVAAPVTEGDVVRTSTTYPGLAFLVVGEQGPIFGSTTLTGAAATPSTVRRRAGFPGFVITASQTPNLFNADAERQLRGALTIADLGLVPSDTVVPRDLVRPYMVQWLETESVLLASGVGVAGRYQVRWRDDPFGLARGLPMRLQNPSPVEAELRAALEGRAVGTNATTTAEAATLIGVAQADLVPARVPFTVHNLTFDRPVTLAMPRRPDDRRLLGSGPDTIRVSVPADVWLPGDRLTFIEDVREDSTTPNGLVLGPAGRPVERLRRAVTVRDAVLGCETPRATCNPLRVGELGATGYNPMHDGDRTEFEYYVGFPETGAFVFDVIPPVRGVAIRAISASLLARVRVVPNPFMIFSLYQSTAGDPRLAFTNVPPRGTLRIYTVAGQFVQQITWEPADLEGDGDLFWNLRSRGGLLVASGLYLWVLTAPSDPSDPGSLPVHGRGKFVVIQGERS